jgi:hypothetical protein
MSAKIIQFPGKPAEETGGFVIKVVLRHAKPPVWRRVLVPSSITLNQLHNIIQEVMGWYDCHLHSFSIGSREYGIPDPDFPDDIIDDTGVRIDSVFREEGQKILRKKKLSQEDKELLEWLGDDYDPEELEIGEINEILDQRDWLDCSTAEW